jgi:hypothetical protein
MPTQQSPKEELAWSNSVKIHRTTENDDASYSVEFVYPSDGGNASINELLRNCLDDFVRQLPKKLANGSQSGE